MVGVPGDCCGARWQRLLLASFRFVTVAVASAVIFFCSLDSAVSVVAEGATRSLLIASSVVGFLVFGVIRGEGVEGNGIY